MFYTILFLQVHSNLPKCGPVWSPQYAIFEVATSVCLPILSLEVQMAVLFQHNALCSHKLCGRQSSAIEHEPKLRYPRYSLTIISYDIFE
jgi:hypothetical protein